MTAMGLRLNHLAILVCLLFLLVCVDCKVNQQHRPDDRSRHLRSHNIHRPPYEGYDWYKHYERDSDPEKEKKVAAARSGHGEPTSEDLKKNGQLSQKEKDEFHEWVLLHEKTKKTEHNHTKHEMVKDIETVLKVIKVVKERGTITDAERSQLTPELKPVALKIYKIFKDKIEKNPDVYLAMHLVIYEIMKKSKSLDSKHRRSRARKRSNH